MGSFFHFSIRFCFAISLLASKERDVSRDTIYKRH